MLVFPKWFTLEELTVSQTAARHGISNTPKGDVLKNLHKTALMMVNVRSLLDKPVIVSSGYRSPEVNAKVGGSNNSAHTLGYAVDFTCPGYGSPLQIAQAIAKSGIKFDQLIHEYNSWVHISFDPRKRGQLLTIDKSGTKEGLH